MITHPFYFDIEAGKTNNTFSFLFWNVRQLYIFVFHCLKTTYKDNFCVCNRYLEPLFLCERKYFFCGVRFSFLVYLLYHCELTTPILRMKPLNSPKGFLYSGRILSKGHTMNIYTVTGQIVKTDLIKDNVSSYDIPQGIYIVELSSTNGKSAKKVQVR